MKKVKAPKLAQTVFKAMQLGERYSVVCEMSHAKGQRVEVARCESLAKAKRWAGELNRVVKSKPLRKSPGAHARRKGHSFEREVANLLKPIFPEARRQLEYHSADANGVDIQNTGRLRFQCKKLKKYAPVSCLKEIVHEPGFGEIPILVTAGDGEPALAVLPFGNFLEILAGEDIYR